MTIIFTVSECRRPDVWCAGCGTFCVGPYECLEIQNAQVRAEAASWKEAWFDQRRATGAIALSEHARGARKISGTEQSDTRPSAHFAAIAGHGPEKTGLLPCGRCHRSKVTPPYDSCADCVHRLALSLAEEMRKVRVLEAIVKTMREARR